jgi:hypothetical protein
MHSTQLPLTQRVTSPDQNVSQTSAPSGRSSVSAAPMESDSQTPGLHSRPIGETLLPESATGAQATGPQRRAEYASRNPVLSSLFVFMDFDEGYAAPTPSTINDQAAQTAATAPMPAQAMSDPEFIEAAQQVLQTMKTQLPRLANALGVAGLPVFPGANGAGPSQLGVYLDTLRSHLPRLVNGIRPPEQAPAPGAGAANSAGTSNADGITATTQQLTPRPVSCTETLFFSLVEREAREVIENRWSMLYKVLKALEQKPQESTSSSTAIAEAIRVFSSLCQLIQNARQNAAARDLARTRESISNAADAVADFPKTQLEQIGKYMREGFSPLPCQAEFDFRKGLRAMEKQLRGWLEQLDPPMRTRSSSSPRPGPKPDAAGSGDAQARSHLQDKAAQVSSPLRKRFVSSGPQSPSKLVRAQQSPVVARTASPLRSPAPASAGTRAASTAASTSATGIMPVHSSAAFAVAPQRPSSAPPPSPRASERAGQMTPRASQAPENS